jgi:hypothetical protein
MAKELLQTQIAFFLRKEFSAFEALSLEIKKQIGEAQTQYLPVPVDAPLEFPRLIINYKDFNVTIFKHRIDLFFSTDYKIDVIEKILNILLDFLGQSVIRVGFIKSYIDDSDIEALKKILPSTKIVDLNIREISLRINVTESIGGYLCNNIEKIDPGSFTSNNGVTKSGLIIAKDCNTHDQHVLPEKLNVNELRDLILELDKATKKLILI